MQSDIDNFFTLMGLSCGNGDVNWVIRGGSLIVLHTEDVYTLNSLRNLVAVNGYDQMGSRGGLGMVLLDVVYRSRRNWGKVKASGSGAWWRPLWRHGRGPAGRF